jgi:hypothetical protein
LCLNSGAKADINVDTPSTSPNTALLHGKVVSDSRDAIMRDKSQGQAEAQRDRPRATIFGCTA